MVTVFADVIGHDKLTALLAAELAHPSHAYLFVGPSGVGKGTVARRFAAALLCGDDGGCLRRALSRSHPDIVNLEPEGRTSITVDQARQAVGLASLAPYESTRKVFLLEEGGLLNDEAANALLKTLEEPTRSTIFIIAAESEDDLPETVQSRCRTVVFGRVTDEEIVAGLTGRGIDQEQAEQAARVAGGRPGLAIALATNDEAARYRHTWLSIPSRLSEHPGDAYLLADEVTKAADPLLASLKARQDKDAKQMESDGVADRRMKDRHEREMKRATSSLYVSGLEILASFYRDAAAAQLGAAVRNPDIQGTALTRVTPARAVANSERVLDAIDALRSNQRPQLAFAALFSDLGDGG
ncbi:MAG: ATP-binding protein [Acidimicrobiia bacterium]